MRVYYITLGLVMLFCYLAQSQDFEETPDQISGSVPHSQSAAFFFLIASGVLIFVAGFRYRVGTDYFTYYFNYREYITELPHSLVTLDEPGFGFIAWLITRLHNSGTAVIFMASLVCIGLPMIVIYRHSDKLLLPAVLFIAMGCWHGSFNGVRQYLAAAVLFCGYRYIKEKNFVKYCIAVFVAFLFHRSAIVMVALYFTVHRKVTLPNILITILVTWVFFLSYERVFSFASFIMDKNYSLDDTYSLTIVNRLRVLAACVPSVTFLVFYWNKELSDEEAFYLNMTIIHAAVRVVTMNSALLYRIGIYTTLFQIIAITKLLKGLDDNNRGIITAGIAAMFLGMWWYEIQGSGSLNHFMFIWS